MPNRRCGKGESVEDLGPRDLVHDKYQPASPIGIWPCIEPLRWEQRVLRRLDDGRPLRAIGKADNAFDPEQVAAARPGQPTQGTGKIEPADLAAEDHPKDIDAMSVGGSRCHR